MRTAILIPVLNEAQALPRVLGEIPADYRVIVCDNGSTDDSVAICERAGVEVVRQPERGYGAALLAGIEHVRKTPPQVVVIMDGDCSTFIEDIDLLLRPIRENRADMVLGDRTALAQPGALSPQQAAGNALATTIIQRRTGFRYRDMGPFRAIRWGALLDLGMEDRTWGWNVEMQMKAVKNGLRVLEVPVRYRPRIGTSKISGTLEGVARAGAKILWACWRYR